MHFTNRKWRQFTSKEKGSCVCARALFAAIIPDLDLEFLNTDISSFILQQYNRIGHLSMNMVNLYCWGMTCICKAERNTHRKRIERRREKNSESIGRII